MDKCLALELSNKYPSMHTDFHRWCHQHNTQPGEAWMWTGPDNIRIVHLITQERLESPDHLHSKATLNNIRHSLSALVKIVVAEKLASIALPRIATGLGDLDWDDVFPLIQNSLGSLTIPIYVYTTFVADKAADEPGA
jgi:O-acetyl-ADP-ribose deacetylase (regulator of RNase III)